MDNASDAICVQLFTLGEAKKSAIFIRKPNLIAPNVPSPRDKSSRIRRQTHSLLAVMQSFVLAQQFSDVHARSNVTSELFLGVVTRHSRVRNPTILAIFSSEPVLHDKRFAPIECVRVNLETPLQIVRVHAFGPAISHFLLDCAAGKLHPGFVKESAEFVRPGHPDKDRSRVSHDPETLLAFAQARL